MKRHRECPRCEKCLHRTVEYGAYVHKWVAGCNAKKCEYVRKKEVEHDISEKKGKDK